MVLHGVPKGLDACRIGLTALEFFDARQVIDGSKFLIQGGFQGMGAVQSLNEAADDLSFLVREVDKPAQVFEGGRDLHQAVHVPVDLLHDEAQLLERINIPVDGAVGSIQLVGQFFDREIGISGH